MTAQVTRYGMLDMQICIPEAWDDAQALTFAEQTYPCGTTNGWTIRRQGDPALGGDDERVPCEGRPACMHLILDA